MTPSLPPASSSETSAKYALGFWAAAAMNIGGVLIFSLGFTNRTLSEVFPAVFDTFGLVSILLWGGAYLAVSRSYAAVPALIAVFTVEKAVYGATWAWWISRYGSTLGEIYGRSPLTAIFYAIYGPNDLAFGLFFAYVTWQTWQAPR